MNLDRAVANAMELKSVNNCEKWGTSMPQDEIVALVKQSKFEWLTPDLRELILLVAAKYEQKIQDLEDLITELQERQE
jgi:hypothetical protein